MITWTYMNIKGQIIDFCPRSLRFHIAKFLFLRDWSIEAKFSVEPPSDGGMKVWSKDVGHMTKMVAMPIYGKNRNNHLLWNQKADDLESWFAALGTRVLLNLFKWWPWDDLDLIYGKDEFGHLCFVWEKGKTIIVFRNYCRLWYKSWYMQSTKWVHEALWIPKVKVIHWFWSKSLRLNIFKLLFLSNHLADWILCGVFYGWGNESVFKLFRSHDQDGHHAHIWWNPLKIFFSGTWRPMTLKLGVQNHIFKFYQVCSNDAPGVTLTCFTARTNLVLYAFV